MSDPYGLNSGSSPGRFPRIAHAGTMARIRPDLQCISKISVALIKVSSIQSFGTEASRVFRSVRGSEEGNNDPECDVTRVFWLPIDEALERSDMWFEDHHAGIETSIGTKDLNSL